MTRPRRAEAAMLVLIAAAGCGGGRTRLNLFSTDWEDDHGASIARVWERVAGTPIPPSADVVVGVSYRGDALVGLPLRGGNARWTYSHLLDARPVVAGGVVIGSGTGELFALDATNGRLLWKRPTGGLGLVGAGDDGTVSVVTFQRSGAVGSVLLAVTHDGQVVRQIETDRPLGAPAVVSRMAFVPWAGQYVSVIDLENGDESARVTLREETSRAWTQGGSLWVGQIGFARFDEHIRNASGGGATMVMVPERRDLPGTPKVMPPGATPLPPASNAEDKARLYARPVGEPGRAATLSDGRYYATYFRLAMGLDSQGAKLAWVRLHPADFVGGAAGEGGVVLCDEAGKVTEYDAKTGGTLAEHDLGIPLRACVVNVDMERLSGAPADGQPLVAQLEVAVRADEPQLAAGQKMLLHELSESADESATNTLVDLASDPRTTPDLLADARAFLAKRRNGARYMEGALRRHYDYLRDVLRSPPVGPIADALAAMKDREGAPLLAAHLLDPSDTGDDVKRAAGALLVLAGPAEVPALRQFFAMYRASADDDDEVADAVVSVGKALLALRGKAGRAEIQAAAADPMTLSTARDQLAEALASPADGGAP